MSSVVTLIHFPTSVLYTHRFHQSATLNYADSTPLNRVFHLIHLSGL